MFVISHNLYALDAVQLTAAHGFPCTEIELPFVLTCRSLLPLFFG